MAKNNNRNDKIKHYYIGIATVLLVFGAGWKAYGHFAKTEVVEDISKTLVWVEERLSIGTYDDRVVRQEGAVARARNRLRFEKKTSNPTDAQIEDVRIEELRLSIIIKEREELFRQYESRKK